MEHCDDTHVGKETTAADDYWLQKAYDLQIGLVKDRENIRKEDKKMTC